MRFGFAVLFVSACSSSGGSTVAPEEVPLPERRDDAGADGAPSCPPTTTACGNACVDLTTNGDHCGACGHSCRGAPCAAGACTPTTLATGMDQPSAIRVQGANAFVLRTNGIDRVPLAGGDAAPLFAATMGTFDVTVGPYALGVDANYAYFFMPMGSTPYVYRCALGGCFAAPSALAPTTVLNASAIDADATTIAWGGTYQEIRQCASASCGSGATLVPSQEGKVQIVLRSSDVFWTNEFNRAVYRCPRASCTLPTELVGGNAMAGSPGPVAIAGEDLYFATRDTPGPKYAIYMCPVTGCGGSPTLVAQGDGDPGTLTADAAAVYWTIRGDATLATGQVLACRAKTSCGTTPVVLATGRPSPLGIATSADAVYWVESRTNGGVAWVAKP